MSAYMDRNSSVLFVPTIDDVGTMFAIQKDFARTVIDVFIKQIHDNAVTKGFWSPVSLPSSLALIHSELSEAIEFFRNHNKNDDKLTQYSGVMVELADTAIRIIDVFGYNNESLFYFIDKVTEPDQVTTLYPDYAKSNQLITIVDLDACNVLNTLANTILKLDDSTSVIDSQSIRSKHLYTEENSFPESVLYLHYLLSKAGNAYYYNEYHFKCYLALLFLNVLYVAVAYKKEMNLTYDIGNVIYDKVSFNKSRSYKHGKLF